MIRPDNFTRNSGNTLGRFLMSLSIVEKQALLSIKGNAKVLTEEPKKHKLHESLATPQ